MLLTRAVAAKVELRCEPGGAVGKYEALGDHLQQLNGGAVELSFAEVAELVGGLPESAYRHRAWWANDRSYVQARGWLESGWQVDEVSLNRQRVRMCRDTAHSARGGQAPEACRPDAAAGVAAAPAVDWPALWAQVAAALDPHVRQGRGHLLTEETVRFATVLALEQHGVEPRRMRLEHREAVVGGAVELVVDVPPTVSVELKYPRDPTEKNAADTMTLGELLRDFYWLARLDAEGWALQVIDERLRGFLACRGEVAWTWTPGEAVRLPPGVAGQLPKTAADLLPSWVEPLGARADCVAAHEVARLVVAAYCVQRTED